ncbi:hypothetical protein Tco_1226945 [Tanacetum coccineum]
MSNILEDIQSAESDNHPPMLDRSDFASWQQRIRLYCMEKDNEEKIIKSIDEGPFKIGKFRETLAEGAEGALHLGPERDRVVADLTPEENDRYKADICATNILLQGLPKYIYTLINHYTDAKDIWDNVKMLLEGSELTKDDRESQLYNEFEHFHNTQLDSGLTPTDNLIKNLTNTLALLTQSYKTYLPQTNNQLRTSSNIRNQATIQNGRVVVQNVHGRQNRGHMARNYTQLKRPLNLEYFKDKMLLMQAQENGVVLDEEQLLFIYLQADQCNAFDSDVDETLTAQTMFMANLSSADPICNEASPLYDSDILSEVQDHDNYQDTVDEHHEVHEIHNDVQPNYIVESDAEYTSDSNMIPYDQYVKDNIEPVVQSNVSFVPNDAYMMIINEMHEQAAQCVSANKQNKVVNASLTAELARYKEQVERYERLARFDLTEREQKIDKHLRIIITGRNIKDESLKKELYSLKMQLNSTINHNKSMVEEVTTLKKDFKQKENKYLEYFLDIRALKEKVEDKLLKQDQSLQTVHMLCKPKPYHDEKKKTNHTRAVMHDSEDTLDIAEKTRIGMLEKMKSTLWVDSKIKITPPDYSKENYLVTFTPHRQLTPEHIFWSSDLEEITPKPISKMIVKFEGIQKALTKDVKEMKEIFEQMEAEVDQNAVDKKKMHDAYTVEQARNAELEAEISKLRCKIQKDDHSEMIKRFSNLEVEHLNLQLKYQHLKESFGNKKSETSPDVPAFDSVFVIGKLKEQLQGKGNTIR